LGNLAAAAGFRYVTVPSRSISIIGLGISSGKEARRAKAVSLAASNILLSTIAVLKGETASTLPERKSDKLSDLQDSENACSERLVIT
jgi:hypothetical protein